MFPHYAGFYGTLPFLQAPVQDMSAAPSELRYARPRYANTAGKDRYSAPTSVSWTANAAVGIDGSALGVAEIPTTIKRYDSMTMRREFGHDAQRYPNGGEGYERVPIQGRDNRLRRYLAAPRMQPGHQNEASRLPAATSFGATVQTVGMPNPSSGTGLFGG